MLIRPGKAVAYSLIALYFSSCAPIPLAEKPLDTAFKPAAAPGASFASPYLSQPRANRLAKRLLQDEKIASIPGISELMESLPGKCALHDLCRVKSEKRQVRKARKLFSILRAIEDDFHTEFRLLGGFEKPSDKRLGDACLAFMTAMKLNEVRTEPGVGFLSGLAAMFPKADCDVSGIIFIHLARLVGIEAIGGKIAPNNGQSGHFVAVVQIGGKTAAIIETTALLTLCLSTSEYAPSADKAVFAPKQWRETIGKKYAGWEFSYIGIEEILLMYTGGTDIGFGKTTL